MTYTVTRQHGTTVTVIGAALSALTHTDAVVPVGTTYTYQVAAVVDGGEAVRSSPVSVTGVPANQPPQAVGTLPPRTLPIADGAVAVSVSDAFQDPEDDTLTYGAVSSAPSVATVGVSGSTVTVKPLTAGTTTITVTATDVDGSAMSAARTFVVTVPNRPPVTVGSLADRFVRVSEGVFTVEVSGAFSDPDNDALTYGAVSSAPSVASVEVSGSAVSVTPVSGGTATISVTATDVAGSNTSATTTFTATVASRPPEAVGSLPPVTRRVADGVVTVEVSGAFLDPDGDVLTYGATSSDPSVARAASSGSTVRVTPVSEGTAVVTVTATDVAGSNMSATQTFAVTVASNRSPEAVGSLSALDLGVEDGARPVDVSGAFRDLDDDPLTYGAVSSDPSVATVSVSASTVTVTPVARGTATTTVTARDAGGSNTTATQTFEVTVANQAPAVAEALPVLDLRVAEGPRSVEVTSAFSDPDGDGLTYGASSSDTSVATVSVSVAVSEAFEDPDDDPLTFEATSSDPLVATASATGSTVRVSAVWSDGGGEGDGGGPGRVAGGAVVRADGAEPGAGGGGHAAGVVARVWGTGRVGGRVGCVRGSGGRPADVRGDVVGADGGGGERVGLDGDGDAVVRGVGDGDGDGDGRWRLEYVGDAGVWGGRGRTAAGDRWRSRRAPADRPPEAVGTLADRSLTVGASRWLWTWRRRSTIRTRTR